MRRPEARRKLQSLLLKALKEGQASARPPKHKSNWKLMREIKQSLKRAKEESWRSEK